MMRLFVIGAALIGGGLAATSTYAVPSTAPTNAAQLDPAPVGMSYEFFTFPSYHTNVTATPQCEKNLKDASGTWLPIRIGGTTQDLSYTVASDKDAPKILKFEPSFMKLAGQYEGSVTLGLNRGHNDVQNTVAAARSAKEQMPNLLAIEMGNEPEYFKNDGQPIAKGTWDAATDAASQASWQISIGKAVGNIIQASNSLQNPPQWGAEQLLNAHNSSAIGYVKTFSHHNYPGGSIQSLMSHANVVKNMNTFRNDVAVAKRAGKQYVFGETNSATGGGAANVSPSFGAGLWVADVCLRAATLGISRLYFHHGTIGACQYCWWGRYSMGAPYYGAMFATAAFGGGTSIVPIDSGNSRHAAYVIFGADGKPVRAALYNSDYFAGSGSRGNHVFVLTGLTGESVKTKKLSAASATSRVDQGASPTWGGQKYEDGTCKITGTETRETVAVEGGRASFTVGASEAVLVYL
ncbi:glycoside hydrolase family 79 protein [Zopfia rhizophila CBS 207.26]|uniref:Glycoside hydrolase family 79 protein n=1 Tax=Zopfia rhizophila CBS 207.26 TaxID=1314779 RepID=A0A6A6EDE9_9PEZI|nr:glycoside hydrolase family 79 protein [Zopfia rhizophila CBS 207.26]